MGKIADLTARKMMEDGVGKMSCLAGVGGRVPQLMEVTKAAKVIVAIDGCPLHCGRNTLQQAGFKKFEHLCLADIGMVKGKTPVTDEAVAKAAAQGKAKLPEQTLPLSSFSPAEIEIFQSVIRYQNIEEVLESSPFTDFRILSLIFTLLRKKVFTVADSPDGLLEQTSVMTQGAGSN